MSGIFNGMLDGSYISPTGSQGGLLPRSEGGGGGGTVDAIARAAAATANTNINAITPQAGETIPVGGVVFTDQGPFENATAGPIVLGATNPPTAASLQADGLTPTSSVDNRIEELTAQANEIIQPGQSVFGPFGQLKNETLAAITLGPTDPPTEASLLADGLTEPTVTGAEDLTAQANEVIQPGESVFGPFGQLVNNTVAAITLGPTDPPTEASLLADGLTPPIVLPPETGTNIPVAQAAFADVEAPLLAELLAWQAANVGAGLTFPISQTPSDLYIYNSPAGQLFTWASGDADSGTDALTLVSQYNPQAGGFEQITLPTLVAITANPNPAILKSIELTATTPTSVVDTQTVVSYPVSPPTDPNQRIDLIRNTAEDVHLAGTFNITDPIINENGRLVTLKAINDLSGWTVSTGGN